MIDEDQVEVIKISDWKPVRARKEHACSFCPEVIKPGDTYFRQAWKVEGDMAVTVAHSPYGSCAFSIERTPEGTYDPDACEVCGRKDGLHDEEECFK